MNSKISKRRVSRPRKIFFPKQAEVLNAVVTALELEEHQTVHNRDGAEMVKKDKREIKTVFIELRIM